MLRAAAVAAEESSSNDAVVSTGSGSNRSSNSSCCTTDAELAMEMSRAADPSQSGDVGILEVFGGKSATDVNNLGLNSGTSGIPAAAVFSSASHGLQDLGLASSAVVANAMEAFNGNFNIPQQQVHHNQGQVVHHQPPVQPVQAVNQALKDMGITPAGGVSALSATPAYRDIAISSASNASTKDIPTSSAAAAAAGGASSSGNYHHITSTKQNSNQQRPVSNQQQQQQPIICVPNQQAPYPHMQQQPRKGQVVKHMTTQGGGSRMPHVQHHPIQHVHKVQQKPGGGMHVQMQQVSSGVVPSHVRHLQAPVSNQRFPLQVGSKSAGTSSGRIQKPTSRNSQVAFPNSGPYNSKPAAKGLLVPTWLPPMGQDSRDALCFTVEDRNMRILGDNDSASEYALARRWVRNDVPRKDHQASYWDSVIPLPKPLSAAEVEKTWKQTDDDPEEEVKVDSPDERLTEEELLQCYISQFKNVRKRFRNDRMKKIARFRKRLEILLPPAVNF